MLRMRRKGSWFVDGIAMNEITAEIEPQEVIGIAQRDVSSAVDVVKSLRKNFTKFVDLELCILRNCWGSDKDKLNFENGLLELEIKLSIGIVSPSEGDDLGAIVEQTSGDKGFVFKTWASTWSGQGREGGGHTSCGWAMRHGTFRNNGPD
jgi:hypothetical protein